MAWLHNYAELEKGELTKDYQALYNQLDAEYGELIDEQPTTTETRKRGRPAKRARRKKPQAIRQARKRTKQLIKKLK